MDYKERLIKFNSTPKYMSELAMLKYLVNPTPYDRILDYGAGIGTALKHLNVNGCSVYAYDIVKYMGEFSHHYDNELSVNYNKVYFMHSFAHIPNIKEVLSNLKRFRPQITIITPNNSYLWLIKNNTYKPDPTVFKHYTQTELKNLLEKYGYEINLIGQFGESINGVNERIFIQTK